ncbi:hypothetical protein BHE74_00059592 [Ensete ventricosum]|nr:hypothetical protein GW17_00062139 [Ensete ventricosum]RWW35469.1 hypothetical protein BHE74_00059592 [Ensete ventricosum]
MVVTTYEGQYTHPSPIVPRRSPYATPPASAPPERAVYAFPAWIWPIFGCEHKGVLTSPAQEPPRVSPA